MSGAASDPLANRSEHRAVITCWDERTISGEISSADAVGISIFLTDQKLSFFEAGSGLLTFERDFFSLDTSYVPVSCLYDVSVAVHHSDGNTSKLTHPSATSEGNARPHSLYGGMWIDRPDWEQTLAAKEATGQVSPQLAELIRVFIRDGYVVIPNAVSEETITALNDDIECAWDGSFAGLKMEVYSIPDKPMAIVDVDRRFYHETHKLLDTYVHIPAAREAAASPEVVAFMAAVFEDQPKAFQQLAFGWGSQQAIHKDTAYVKIDGNPMSMLATWIALEDISEGTGELEYYVGSHRAPDYVFGGVSKWMEAAPHEHDSFLASLHSDADEYGHRKAKFLAKRGDILIWHADLAHGGSAITKPGISRKSLVTHFTAAKNDPYYRRWSSNPPYEHGEVQFVSSNGPIRP